MCYHRSWLGIARRYDAAIQRERLHERIQTYVGALVPLILTSQPVRHGDPSGHNVTHSDMVTVHTLQGCAVISSSRSLHAGRAAC